MKIDNLIIGSGITGLSFACFSKGDYIILEKESTPGGYCKTSYQ
jgi:protoporphyrinogen oxidase